MAMCENRGVLRVGRSSRGRHGDVRKTLAFSLVFDGGTVVTTSSWRCAKIVGFFIGFCGWGGRHDVVMAMCENNWFSLVFDGGTVATTSSWRCAKIVGFHWFLMVGRSSWRCTKIVGFSWVFDGGTVVT